MSEYDTYTNDNIAGFLKGNKDLLLEAVYMATISRPSVVGSLKYRNLHPEFLDAVIREFFSPETLKITGYEGKSYDWDLLGKKISIKSTSSEVFPRAKKFGIGVSKCQPIQLKNTKKLIIMRHGDFDYLLIIVSKLSHCGLYLLTFEQVLEHLKKSRENNSDCDGNGYDGKGQIKLYLKDKESCLAYIEMDDKILRMLKDKYSKSSKHSDEERTREWLIDQNLCIRKQILMTKGER